METRTIVEGKVYVLFMNPIQGRAENSMPVAAASEYNTLVNWYLSKQCDPYRDDWMNKHFIRGSELEFYNPVPTLELNQGNHWHQGIYEYWIQLDGCGKPEFDRNLHIKYLG